MNNRIELVKGDITECKTEAIVNAANNSLLGGGGVDGAIHRAAGPKLIDECRSIGGCPTGEARITNGYNLEAKYIIHTVGPVWYDGNKNETEDLAKCYVNSLQLAKEKNIKTIAFPSISTGIYRFPIDKASKIALRKVNEFLDNDDSIEKIIFVCYSEEDYKVYEEGIKNIYQDK
ncbi:MAG: O-acetyl-ADP-ribose deacetylase [Melioribacteraceae bacterium]|nr:O-acetyl-ADP-ribose deacetylase [Melioribacteraceae bacterium]MCF8354292.1 O-acetyl-ADP-ribose deacetylase [Melioribacteraceae bacterium]MCF8394576.1 O-acetyl-ADP-ribose deacetylase [Melioribacteraceae bacterium]MCF8419755.1 O-acetyl-ADP-ribose deacetylase [Melioribacteraceae bacterium]